MKLLKRWKEHPDKLVAEGLPIGWFHILDDDVYKEIKRLKCYWKPETVIEMLSEGNTLWTSFAEYKLEK